MARKDKQELANKKIENIASNIQNNMDALYTTTYFSTPAMSNDVKILSQNINDNIDRIVSRNMNTIGMPSVSILYSRLFNKNNELNNNSLINGVNKLFEDPMMMDDLYSTFMSNRFLQELDDEIDTVCQYMPELEEALDTKKDSVLSADHFSKDFLNVRFPGDIDNEKFSNRITELKKKYKLQKITEEIYEKTSKYGEQFVYCVPYEAAITRLLVNKPKTNPFDKPYLKTESVADIVEGIHSMTERFVISMDSNSCSIISENGSKLMNSKPSVMTESVSGNGYNRKTTITSSSILNANESFKIGIEINNSGIIESAITEAMNLNNARSKTPKSLKESWTEDPNLRNRSSFNEDKQPQAGGNLNFHNVLKTARAADGLISNSLDDEEKLLKQNKVTVPGAVVKLLKRKYVIPIYIEESCVGYYYIEVKTKDAGDEMLGFRNLLGDPMTGPRSEGRSNFNNVDSMRQEETIKYVAGQLSQFIDKKFVNANQDLAKEIYEILKFNDLFNTPSMDLIKITFVPPEDIHHSYFTFDTDSHRGISDLAKGLIPAKLYSSLYITNAIGIMTRGQDKRVYRVKQMVDSNIAQQLLNVVNQIKMGNFGIRQFNSINNILNITGKFNDFIMPTGPSGDPPIDIDVIQGQQFDIHTDLMELLKEMAINSTGVPLEIIQTRQSVDYAMQLSMSSSKFLRTVYKRQERFQEIMSPLISAIYNYEYGETTSLDVTFPPPVFLDMANTNQLINNTKDFVDSIIDVEMQNEQDDVLKARYRDNLFMHYIGTHIDISTHKSILEQTKVQIKKEQKESEIASAQAPSEEESGGYDNW